MARTDHATYTAFDRFERRASRRKQPVTRRANTRSAVLALAVREG